MTKGSETKYPRHLWTGHVTYKDLGPKFKELPDHVGRKIGEGRQFKSKAFVPVMREYHVRRTAKKPNQ